MAAARRNKVAQPTVCAGFRARAAARSITRLYDRILRPAGLSSSQFAVLATLHLDGAMTMRALSQALGVDPSTTTRAVMPLARAGLLRVSGTAGDRRVHRVALTAKGRRTVLGARKHWEHAQAELRRRIGSRRFERLVTDLGAVVEALGDRNPAGGD